MGFLSLPTATSDPCVLHLNLPFLAEKHHFVDFTEMVVYGSVLHLHGSGGF